MPSTRARTKRAREKEERARAGTWTLEDLDEDMAERRRDEAARNRARFLQMRALGKTYWQREGGGLFWLNADEVAARRANGETFVEAAINYDEPNTPPYCVAWKQASQATIEDRLNHGHAIVLYEC